MRLFNLTLACLMGVTGLTSTLYVTGQTLPSQQDPIGFLELSENENGAGDACQIQLDRTRNIDLGKDSSNCKNDQMSYYKLVNVSSSVFISLESNTCTQDDDSWKFKIRTLINPVTTNWNEIEALRNRPVGWIIARGMRLERGYHGTDNIKGKLTCIRIVMPTRG